jgi:hypothetical protein
LCSKCSWWFSFRRSLFYYSFERPPEERLARRRGEWQSRQSPCLRGLSFIYWFLPSGYDDSSLRPVIEYILAHLTHFSAAIDRPGREH